MSTSKKATPRTRAGTESTTESSGCLPEAAAAGDGIPGTNTAAAEIAREEAARIAEALTPPGGDLGELLAPAPGTTRLRVRALRNGRRRAGRAWPATGVEVPVSEFSEEQIRQLRNDPFLSVTSIARPEGT